MSKQIQIDCYGNPNILGSRLFLSPLGKKHTTLVDSQNDTTYLAFAAASTGNQPIHRIKETGMVTETLWAYGEWDNRSSLTYELTKNQPATITVE